MGRRSKNLDLKDALAKMELLDVLIWNRTPIGTIHAIVSRDNEASGGDWHCKCFTFEGQSYIVRVK